MMCVLSYGAGASAIALTITGSLWSNLLALILFVVCLATYYPLHVFSSGIDYQVRVTMPFGTRKSGGASGDEAALLLLASVDRATRWLMGSTLMLVVLYPMAASQLGWWLPTSVSDDAMVIIGTAGYVCSVTTVVWSWMEPGTHDLPYPADEDLT